MKAIERHRKTWQDKSDEWLFERLDNELKQKVGGFYIAYVLLSDALSLIINLKYTIKWN